MTEPVQEQLSACLDGELPEAELDLLLKRVGRDAPLRQVMGRYALIGEALRAERPVIASAGFAGKVAAAIDAEQSVTPRVAKAYRGNRFSAGLRPAVGWAVAAGVAAVAVVTLQPRTEPPAEMVAQDSAPAISTIAPPASNQESASYTVPVTTNGPAFIAPTRLTNYVVAHSEYATPLGRRTVLSGVLAEDDVAQDETPAAAAESDVSTSTP